ncbi:MAG: alpha-glucan family phosphorylase [Candidatus Omnitrophica bacterium]|nr:alpha-glucan family phosphorylase [Candidatus Omnitrophota bacterium]
MNVMESSKLTSEFHSLVAVEGFKERYKADIRDGTYFGLPLEPIIAVEKRLRCPSEKALAYFSMEYGLATSFYNTFTSSAPLDPQNISQEQEVFSNFRLADFCFNVQREGLVDLPIYSGGLGVLAGGTVKTMADYKLPAVAVGMLWHAGYFRQRFWFKYGQAPEEMRWDMHSYPGLVPLENRVSVQLRSETVRLKLWKYYVYSYQHDAALPLVLLDANIEENRPEHRRLTAQLYRSDNVWIRILQRVVLGMGGIAALRDLGYRIDTVHLNEGHAVFAFIEKAREFPRDRLDELRDQFVYTCHTPVAAGHDRFSAQDMKKILTDEDYDIALHYGADGNLINLTLLAMNAAVRVNAVSRAHQQVMHLQFPSYRERIQYVTNGVHTHTWISDSFKELYEQYRSRIGDIKANPMALGKVRELMKNEQFRRDTWEAHQRNKRILCGFLRKWGFDENVFTICWARRVAAYKRPSMLFHDTGRLIKIAAKRGPLQIIFAGKAHPQDDLGFTFISNMLDAIDGMTDVYSRLRVVMLENYSIPLARLLTSGVDVWLNNPLPPFEASGTSGMKAILNGVLQLSTVDGWIAEAAERPIGRLFGYRNPAGQIGDEHDLHMADDARELYAALEEMVAEYYRLNKKGSFDYTNAWIDMMVECMAVGAQFNTYRMCDEYKSRIWKRMQ